jgi:hypothetical protein
MLGWAFFLVLCALGGVAGFIVANVKLIRDARTPLWSHYDKGVKVHGYFAWWGHFTAVVDGGVTLLFALWYGGHWVRDEVEVLRSWLGV